jgi:transketolase
MKDIASAATVIRGLAMDAVQAAKSGHPGMPMGAADYAALLFLRHLNYCPDKPDWPNRDRFVLSAGHGSTLLYSLLHLAGYDMPLDELRAFRQFGSKTPGHPEARLSPGVETTSGPLGQGCANAVGMALAEAMLAERFNTADAALVDHRTYVICSDGDLMEGISHEACSLAGHLGLHKLTLIYDSNNITIEGSTDLTYSDDVRKRFEGYNWHVIDIDGHDHDQIDDALVSAGAEASRPTIIIARTHIGRGSPNMHDTSKAHGAPLGEDEVKASKRNLGLPEDESFYVSDDVRELFRGRAEEGARKVAEWEDLLASVLAEDPAKADAWHAFFEGAGPDVSDMAVPEFEGPIATRAASGKMLQELAKVVPNLVGGSADLAPSTNTLLDQHDSVGPGSFAGRNLHFGVREHGMAGIMNGIALHGGFRVFGATFFVFFDYCRPSVRMAALSRLPVIYVFTHDSFYVGEDGPTHQPVEQLASLRCMPNVTVLRPADATETAAAWTVALGNTAGPTALILTRHKLPVLDRAKYAGAAQLEKGAYVLWQSADGVPDITLIGTGSEVHLALEAAEQLAREHVVRVVSMPSRELFDCQPDSYKSGVIPADCPVKLVLEAGSPLGWHRYIGPRGRVLGMTRYGASGPYKVLAEEFGFTARNVISIINDMLSGS